jgi:hypothetical protein
VMLECRSRSRSGCSPRHPLHRHLPNRAPRCHDRRQQKRRLRHLQHNNNHEKRRWSSVCKETMMLGFQHGFRSFVVSSSRATSTGDVDGSVSRTTYITTNKTTNKLTLSMTAIATDVSGRMMGTHLPYWTGRMMGPHLPCWTEGKREHAITAGHTAEMLVCTPPYNKS